MLNNNFINSNNFLDWFVGFSEGFIIDKNNNKCFEIWQHISDIHTLEYIKYNLNIGTLRTPNYRPNMAIFNISKKDEYSLLFEIFQNKYQKQIWKILWRDN